MIDTTEVTAQVLSKMRDKQNIEYVLRWQARQPATITLLSAKEVSEALGMSLRMTHRLLRDIRTSGTEIGLLFIPKTNCNTYKYSENDMERIGDYVFVRSSKRNVADLRR